MDDKLIAFEYIITKLIAWLRSLNPELSEDQALQEFNKLKLFKLHFFVSAIDVKKEGEAREDLLDIFDAFYALPYGPVESYVYNHLSELSIYLITSGPISRKREIENYFDVMCPETRDHIDESIEKLRIKNEDIVTYPAFDLVELSHQWSVWRLLYDRAVRQGKRSTEMSSELIRVSSKIYK